MHFGKIRVEDRPDQISQLVGSFIGSRTYDWKSWDAFADATVADLEAPLEGVTFSEKKAPELREALRSIRTRFGQIDLNFLANRSVDQALNCLEQIHGIGRKIAAATLNFSVLRKCAFVVDMHVLRVLRRFGFVGMKADTEAAYNAVMAAADDLDADYLFELHWQIKRLGQTICTHAQASCASCPLSDICPRRMENLTTLKAFLNKPGFEEAPYSTGTCFKGSNIAKPQ